MKMDVRVGQCMTVGVFTLPADKKVADAARLLRKTSIGSIIVMQKGKAKGIITKADILRAI
ncbi:MAG: CBS domain-containing protein [Candidatus Micrarchaeota archaeon]|nr:CBS domain-containing protein [Candidatus Micrarchaeota archaeon]